MALAGVRADRTAVLELLLERIGHRFSRAEPRQRARMFVHGILSGPARKNGWTLAEFAGESDPNGMQRLLTTARWDVDGVRDDLRDWILERFGDRTDAILVPTEAGFPKKGTASVGVHRQYNGMVGRTENVQVGIFLSCAAGDRWALVDRELYLPRAWAGDAERCRQLGVPDGVGFATRPQLARRMLQRVLDEPGPRPWVAGDETYGDDPALRSWLAGNDVPYVLATRCLDRVSPVRRLNTPSGGPHGLPWERDRAGFDWARVPGHADEPMLPGWESFLLVRRSGSGPVRFGFHHCHARAGTPLSELVRVAAAGAGAAQRLAQARTDLGLDQYQVRRYDAWYRHVTLCMLAGAYLAVAG
jgi:SRSO17 transposase